MHASDSLVHSFGNLLDRLKPEWREKLESMMPPDSVTKAEALAAYKAIYDCMLQSEDQLFRDEAPCSKCQQNCSFKGNPAKRRLLIAGTECRAWAAGGLHNRHADPSMLTFLVYVFDLRRNRYDLAIHEITELHPESLLPYFLKHIFDCTTIRVSPYHLGWPARRPRKFTILSRLDVPFTGSQEGFMQFFAQLPQIDPHALWIAPDADVHRAFMERAEAKCLVPRPGAAADYATLLTPSEKRRIADAKAISPLPDPTRMFIDINTSAKHGPTPGLFIPTLLTHSKIWSEFLQRPCLAKEKLLFQGVPAFPAASSNHHVSWPSMLDDEQITEHQASDLAGNAMCVPVIGTVALYALACTSDVLPQSLL